jgi:hypothetical protein
MMKLRDLCFRLEEDTLSMTWTSDRGRPWCHNIAVDRFWVVLRLVRRRLQDGEPLVLQELISDTRYPAYQIHLVFRWLQATGLIHRELFASLRGCKSMVMLGVHVRTIRPRACEVDTSHV